MIMCCDLMVRLGLTTNFNFQVLKYDGATVPMKGPRGILGKSDLNMRNMHEVVMHTAEPASNGEATERLVKILEITYAKANLKHVADNATHLNADKRTQLLRLLEDLKDLFDSTLGDWDTESVNHIWDLPVLHYHKILVIHPYPFLVVITQLFSWIILINDCIFILTGSPG